MAPLIWYRRRQHPDLPPENRRHFEMHGYSDAAVQFFAAGAIDKRYIHRADLDEDSIIFDVGAAYGKGAQELFNLYGATVYAFEPQPLAFEKLRERFVDNPKVHALPYGLGSEDALVPMELAGMASTLRTDGKKRFKTVDIQIRDIAAVVDELGIEQIDLIKINIEGGEFDLLPRILESGLADRTRYFLIQFHEWYRGAHRGRWHFRRAIQRTHSQVWNHDWIFELWCAKDRPHPAIEVTPELVEAIRRDILASRAKQKAPAVDHAES